jgi:cytosine/adenosine deaminase-related metal-dependent hydrolase
LSKTLIKNGWVISMDPEIGERRETDVLIEDDRIAAVGRDLSDAGAEVIDATDRLVMPGLINAHLHLWQTGLRGVAGNWISAMYHKNIHGNLATRFQPEDAYLGTLIGALGQIDAGTTCVMDWCHNNATPDHTDRSIDALMESGIRAVFGHGTVKPPQAPGMRHFSEIPHPRGEIERLRGGRLGSDDGLVTLAMAILGPEYSAAEVMLEDFRLAREFGLVTSSHDWNKASRVCKEGFFPVAREGLLGPSHNVVHGNFLGDEELRLIVDHGASVTVTPTVEMQTSHGDPLTGRLLALGASPSLGADTEIFVAGDMFHVMRFSLQAQRALDHRAHAGRGEPLDHLTISPRQALEWATIEGARALMMEDRIGSLSPGKQADVILIRADDVAIAPINDPVQAIVLYAGPANVDTVIIAGQAVKRDGQLVFPSAERRRKQERLADSVQRVFRDGDYVHQAV